MKHVILKISLIEYAIRVDEFAVAVFLIVLHHPLVSGVVLIILDHKRALSFALFRQTAILLIGGFACLF
jgi:hypothetical protein